MIPETLALQLRPQPIHQATSVQDGLAMACYGLQVLAERVERPSLSQLAHLSERDAELGSDGHQAHARPTHPVHGDDAIKLAVM